jgi:hypothetical protein
MNKPQEGVFPFGFLALSRGGMNLAAIRDELRRPERRAGVFHPQNL